MISLHIWQCLSFSDFICYAFFMDGKGFATTGMQTAGNVFHIFPGVPSAVPTLKLVTNIRFYFA